MASSMSLLKRATSSSNLLNKFINPIRYGSVAPSSLRSFNRSADLITDSSDDDEELNMIEHRSDSLGHHRAYAPTLYSGGYMLDPFAPPVCLIDNYGWNPFVAGVGDPRGERVSAMRRGWNVVEDEDALYLKVDMPGLGKEDVKVSVEKSTLVIKGEGEKDDGDEENVRRYSNRIDLPEDLFKIGEIKAEMKNGVLKVSVPKVKDDEKKDVVEVNVE